MTTTTTAHSVVMKYYNKYEKLATVYARQIYDSFKIGMDFDDLVQEFRLKIYTSIIAYAKKWEQYKATGRYKPVPIELYIKSSLNNKKKDLYKVIDDSPFNISVEETGFDYSEVNTSFLRLNPKEGVAEINGIDLLNGLSKIEGKCFLMYIYGFPVKKLQKLFKSSIQDVKVLIENHIQTLKQHYSTLSESHVTVYKTYSLEEA